MTPEDIYETRIWKPEKTPSRDARFLSKDLFEITLSNNMDPYTGRKMLYRFGNFHSLEFIGVFSEYHKLKYHHPKTYVIDGTNWIVSEEVSASGTGISEEWGRYWLLNNNLLKESLALPICGTQAMSTEDPVRSYKVNVVPEKCSDSKLLFSISATCKILYGDDQNESLDLREFSLKEIIEEVCFEKGPESGEFEFSEKLSSISLSRFRSITNLEMNFDDEFLEIYGNEILKMLDGPLRDSIKMWLKNSRISLAIQKSDKWNDLKRQAF